MCRTRVLASLAVVLALTLVAAICGASPAASTAKDSGDTVVQAYQKLASLKNCHMTAYILATIDYKGKTVNTTINSDIDLQLKPVICQSITTVIANVPSKKFTQQTEQYMEEVGDQFHVYSKINGKWVKQTLPKGSYSPLTAYEKYAKAIKKVAKIRETADSSVFEVIISADDLQQDIERQLASFGLPTAFAGGLFKDLGDLKYFVTIDKATTDISVIDIDLSPIMAKLGNNAAQSFNLPEAQKTVIKELLRNMKMFTRITLSKFDSVEEFTIPDEAKNAAEDTAMNLPAALL